MSVIISCSGKFHAFALAEQLERHGMLNYFYTSYAYQKNTFLRRFVRRVDREIIPTEKIFTNTLLAFPIKLLPGSGFIWLQLYDRWVAGRVKQSNSKIFIGWSGMSLQSIRAAKATGKITIVERGSSHILYQNELLIEEYKKFGIDFSIDKRMIEKELKEYQEADYISIPSTFVKKSFIKYGVAESKLIVNHYGSSVEFAPGKNGKRNDKFTILYLGAITIQKGLVYLFEALNKLDIEDNNYEVWFVGKIHSEMKTTVEKYKKGNWKFLGQKNFYDLPSIITKCDIAVMPSLQDGFGMVINQILACGIPVIATENTGGPDIIDEGINGFIVPIRDPDKIGEKINLLFSDSGLLAKMKEEAAFTVKKNFSWSDYGNRYAIFLNNIINQ